MEKFSAEVSSNSVSDKFKSIKKPVMMAQFENGNLKSSGKSKIKFTSYKCTANKSKRLLVAQSNRLSYCGSNFESKVSQITSSVLKIGVLNKKTNSLKLYDADLFFLKPQLKCPDIINIKADKSYSEKSSDLALAFGSKTQQRKINSRIKYNSATVAADFPDSFADALDSISDSLLEQKKEILSDSNKTTSIIPPQNSSAVNVEQIYNINDIVSAEELNLLDLEAQVFIDFKHRDIQLWKYPDFIIHYLENNAFSMNIYKAKLLCYLNFMFCFLRTGYADWKKKEPLPSVPQPFKQKLMDCFTINKSMPMRLKDKLLAHTLVLVLILTNFVINCNIFASSAKMNISRITTVAQALGCHVSGNVAQKIIQLKLPLYKFETGTKRKYKKQ